MPWKASSIILSLLRRLRWRSHSRSGFNRDSHCRLHRLQLLAKHSSELRARSPSASCCPLRWSLRVSCHFLTCLHSSVFSEIWPSRRSHPGQLHRERPQRLRSRAKPHFNYVVELSRYLFEQPPNSSLDPPFSLSAGARRLREAQKHSSPPKLRQNTPRAQQRVQHCNSGSAVSTLVLSALQKRALQPRWPASLEPRAQKGQQEERQRRAKIQPKCTSTAKLSNRLPTSGVAWCTTRRLRPRSRARALLLLQPPRAPLPRRAATSTTTRTTRTTSTQTPRRTTVLQWQNTADAPRRRRLHRVPAPAASTLCMCHCQPSRSTSRARHSADVAPTRRAKRQSANDFGGKAFPAINNVAALAATTDVIDCAKN